MYIKPQNAHPCWKYESSFDVRKTINYNSKSDLVSEEHHSSQELLTKSYFALKIPSWNSLPFKMKDRLLFQNTEEVHKICIPYNYLKSHERKLEQILDLHEVCLSHFTKVFNLKTKEHRASAETLPCTSCSADLKKKRKEKEKDS